MAVQVIFLGGRKLYLFGWGHDRLHNLLLLFLFDEAVGWGGGDDV